MTITNGWYAVCTALHVSLFDFDPFLFIYFITTTKLRNGPVTLTLLHRFKLM